MKYRESKGVASYSILVRAEFGVYQARETKGSQHELAEDVDTMWRIIIMAEIIKNNLRHTYIPV